MSKLLLAAGMALICGTAAWGKNNVPDFRYPETVINDATKQIEKADKKGNHKALVDGLVRLSRDELRSERRDFFMRLGRPKDLSQTAEQTHDGRIADTRV